MAITPWIAPVGKPFELVNDGRAWNARYRYDEPSTSTSFLLAMINLSISYAPCARKLPRDCERTMLDQIVDGRGPEI